MSRVSFLGSWLLFRKWNAMGAFDTLNVWRRGGLGRWECSKSCLGDAYNFENGSCCRGGYIAVLVV